MLWSRFKELLGDYFPIKEGRIPVDLMATVLADGALGAEQPLRRIDKYIDVVKTKNKPRDLRKCRRDLDADERRLIECYDQLEDLVLVAEHKASSQQTTSRWEWQRMLLNLRIWWSSYMVRGLPVSCAR